MPEASARSGSCTRLVIHTGGSRVSKKTLPPWRPTLPVSTSSTRIRYEINVEKGVCSTPRS